MTHEVILNSPTEEEYIEKQKEWAKFIDIDKFIIFFADFKPHFNEQGEIHKTKGE